MSFHRIVHLVSIAKALLRAQLFLLPALNTGLVRMYGRVRLRGRKANLRIGRRCVFLGDAVIVCGHDGHRDDRIEIGERVKIEHGSYLNAHGGSIRIGDDAFIGVGSVIQGKGGVDIGRAALLGPYVQIFSSDHPTAPGATDRQAQPESTAPISVGDNVWLGASCILLRGTSLHAGSVVAAGSVVRLQTDGATLAASADGLAQAVRRLD